MKDLKLSRATALIALIITAFAVIYAAVGALTSAESSLGWLIQAGIHVGELAAVIALALSGAAGSGLPARIGLGAATLGQAILVIAELVFPRDPDLGDALFAVGPVLSGAGLVVAGIAVLRARRWTGLARFAPMTVGIYTLLVLIPILVVSDGPPAPVALWAISGWDLLWFLLAAAAPASMGRAARRAPGRLLV